MERRIVGAFVRTLFLRRRRGRAWAVPDWLPHKTFRLAGNSGADLSARWFPASDARGVVVLAHPDRRYGQHWFVNEGRVDFLHDRGFHVLTFDFPDYGTSRGGSTYYFEDVIAACREARDRAPGLPVNLVGVSLGAFSAANAAPHLDFLASLVLESPYPSFDAWYGRGPGRWGMAAFNRLFPRTAALIQADRNMARIHAPRILVVAGGRDDVTPPDLSKRVAARGPPERTRYLEIPGARHLEIFSESSLYRDALLETLASAVSPRAVREPGASRRSHAAAPGLEAPPRATEPLVASS